MERELRTHHLCIFFDNFLHDYYEFSEGLKPWEFGEGQLYKLISFAKNYAQSEIGKDVRDREDFEEDIIEDPDAIEKYEYLIDLIGTNKEQFDKTLEGRTQFFIGIFELAYSGKDKKIVLVNTPDAYCKSCAIGKHCLDKSPSKINMDLLYLEALEHLMDEFGGIEKNSEDGVSITTELFFDPLFYSALKVLVKKYIWQGNGFW